MPRFDGGADTLPPTAMVKKFGWASATNTLVTAAESCADGSFSEKDSASVKQVGP